MLSTGRNNFIGFSVILISLIFPLFLFLLVRSIIQFTLAQIHYFTDSQVQFNAIFKSKPNLRL